MFSDHLIVEEGDRERRRGTTLHNMMLGFNFVCYFPQMYCYCYC